MNVRIIPRRRFTRGLLGAGLLAWLCAAPTPSAEAAAPKDPTAEVMVILASQGDVASVDKALADVPQLAVRPLNLYNNFKLIDKKQLALPPGEGVPYAVKDGGPTLSLTFVGPATTPAPEKDKPRRYKLSVEMASGKTVSKIAVVAGANERVFIGGPTYKSGTLFFGVRVRP